MHPLLDDPMDVVLPRRTASPAQARRLRRPGRRGLVAARLRPDSPSFRLINRGCVAAGFEPQIVFRINDCQMTQAMVAAGEGIACSRG